MRALAAAAALAIALALAPAASARRTVPPGFLGVVADGVTLDGTVALAPQMRRMHAAGAESVGLTFNWVDAQPYATLADVPAARRARFAPAGPDRVPTDFAPIDRRVLAAARAGLRVHPVVIAAPVWARLHPALEFSPPADPAAYASFLDALVRRYGPGGGFWAAHRGVRALPIRDWQIWNEPVGGDGDTTPSVFWADDQPFQTRYVALLRAAHDAIKAADPRATVVLGGLVGLSWKQLQLIYDSGARGAFDAVALHPYTARPRNVVRIVRNVRQVMRRNGDGAKPIEITELGWPAFDVGGVRALGRGEADRQQASWLHHTFTALIRQRRRLGIDLLLWYAWIGRDASRVSAFDYSGLLHLSGRRTLTSKPALQAFSAIAHSLRR